MRGANVFISILAVIGLALLAWVIIQISPRIGDSNFSSVTNFEECVAAGNPVMESYPRQCRSADGKLFVENPPAGGVPPQQNLSEPISVNGCAPAGCSNQLCVSV